MWEVGLNPFRQKKQAAKGRRVKSGREEGMGYSWVKQDEKEERTPNIIQE